MIVDVFPFFMELDMLEYRLELLFPHVDFFVISEATRTFRGLNKPLYFKDNMERFEKYLSKIIYFVDYELLPNTNPWENEMHQRDSALKAVYTLNLGPNDIIINCDIDEIPDPEIVKNLDSLLTEPNMKLEMDWYFYTPEYQRDTRWNMCNVLRYSALPIEPSLTKLRHKDMNKIENAGWHMSNFGGAQFVKTKIYNWSHYYEYEEQNKKTIEQIDEQIKDGIDILSDKKLNYVTLSENPRPPPIINQCHICLS